MFINQREPPVTKTQLLKVIAQSDGAQTLTKVEKFQVFCKVCDNALEGGHITKAQHTRWTNIF